MSAVEIINLISAIASLILSVLAIWLSLYFYDKSKSSEAKVNLGLEAIKTQTKALQELTGKWMDRLTKYATSAKPADEATVWMMEIIRSSVSNVSSQLTTPGEERRTIQNLTEQLVTSYIAIYYYVALTNITSQGYLPNLSELDENNPIKTIVDSSNADFWWLDNILTNMNSADLQASPLHHLYIDTITNKKQHIKDSTGVFQSRLIGEPTS